MISEALGESERCPLHLENTAGAGGTLGRSFQELAALIEAAGGGQRLGVCLDSCHLLACGYDIRTPAGLTETFDRFDRITGWTDSAACTEDSQMPLGSNRDRHANVGQGELGEQGCAAFVSEPRFEKLPCVLETQGPERQGSFAGEVLRARLRHTKLLDRRSSCLLQLGAMASAGGGCLRDSKLSWIEAARLELGMY